MKKSIFYKSISVTCSFFVNRITASLPKKIALNSSKIITNQHSIYPRLLYPNFKWYLSVEFSKLIVRIMYTNPEFEFLTDDERNKILYHSLGYAIKNRWISISEVNNFIELITKTNDRKLHTNNISIDVSKILFHFILEIGNFNFNHFANYAFDHSITTEREAIELEEKKIIDFHKHLPNPDLETIKSCQCILYALQFLD